MAASRVSDPSQRTGVHKSIAIGMVHRLSRIAPQITNATPTGKRRIAGGMNGDPIGPVDSTRCWARKSYHSRHSAGERMNETIAMTT